MKHRKMSLLITFVSFVSLVYVACEDLGHTQLKIEVHPEAIYPILTKELQLRCSVENFLRPIEEEWATFPGKTNKLLWNYPMEKGKTKLLSLVIIKTDKVTGLNQTVASVKGFESPIVEKQFIGSVSVEGKCEGSPNLREQSYISLTWDRPTEDQAGHFMCVALGLNSDKQDVSLIASLEITAAVPTISDLVKYISLNEKYMYDLKTTVSQINEEKEDLRLRTETLEKGFQKIQQGLGFNMNGSVLVQSGRVQCGQQSVQFNPAFSNPPKVFTSATSLSGNLRAMEYVTISYSVSITNVTNTHFVIVCDMGRLSTLTLDWIAIGFQDG